MRIAPGFSEADRPLVAALYWEAFRDKLGRAMGPSERALAFFEATLSPDHALCARDHDGRIVGVAGFKTAGGALVAGGYRDMARVYGRLGAAWRLALLSALMHDTDNRRFLMDGIFVAPEMRGRGVGTELLRAFAREAAARGYREVRLDVIEGNDRARALYEREGYRAVATHSIGLLRHVFGFRAAITMVREV